MFDARSRVTPGPRRPAPPAPRSQHAPLLQLQATAGNAAVGQLLAVQRAPETETQPKRTFTAQELVWVDEVLGNEMIAAMLRLYGGQNEVILRRVASLGGSTEGSSAGNEISMSDATYTRKETLTGESGEDVAASREEEFKLTLFHELFHFFENRVGVGDVPAFAAPERLKRIMLDPHEHDYPVYAFGWFLHPKTLNYLHFDLPEINTLGAEDYVDPDSPVGKFKASGAWEHSPMPRSGNDVDVEEDLATTVALFLTSFNSRRRLKADFPLRFGLMVKYFAKAIPKALEESGR